MEEEEEEDEEEEDEEEEEEDEEEEEEDQTAKVVAQSIRKGEEDDDDEFDFRRQQQASAYQQSPPQQARQPPPAAPQARQAAPVQHAGKERKLANEAHDEAFDIDDEDDVVTPRRAEAETQHKQDLMSKQLQNAAHDEEFEVDDERDVSTPPAGANQRASAAPSSKLANHHHDEAFDVGDDEEDVSSDEEVANTHGRAAAMPQQTFTATMQRAAAREQEEEESSSEEDEEGGLRPPAPKGNEYNPQEYQNLNVSKDVKDLFQFITQYKPHTIDLETKLKPFIPDYIPAVGDIDTFIKIPRPDNKPDNLGLTVLDEPAATQSNPAVVKIGLSYGSKKKAPSVFVESIEDARNRPTLIDKWMTDIGNLHKKKPAPTVHYTKHQPDVENLLQVWPAEFEDLLSSAIMLPPAKLNVELYQYVKLICCLLDIPVYSNLIESLHVLFTLYTEFKANQHFQNGPELNGD
eukprot:GGOE01000888.1.p1 GENE.GGOE01000888.1~~GGOE01000888.1.p1  ORF type:complete len:478 (-),score=126.18 GGOE01000888.1:312-1697(-)